MKINKMNNTLDHTRDKTKIKKKKKTYFYVD
jgi:hypothetical protein